MWERALKWVWHFIRALNDVDGDVVAQRVWRRSMALAVTVIILTLAGGFTWAAGVFPGTGFASAATVRDVQVAQNATALFIVKAALHDALVSRCLAFNRQNQPALDSANRDIDAAIDNFVALRGERPFLPDCSVVLIRDNTQRP